MDCERVRKLMLDFIESALAAAQQVQVREHLADCDACRAECERLEQASLMLRDSVDALAPVQSYATAARVGRLMAAAHRPIQFRAQRAWVALAATIMIVVCAVSIWSSLGLMSPESAPPAPVAQNEEAAVFVLLAAQEPAAPIREVHPRAIGTAPEAPPTVALRPRLATLDTPDLCVPVDQDFYDHEEASRWW
jgi:predicted anti-sigma-YlaC factor YlaD